jgi:prophage regulatory protein
MSEAAKPQYRILRYPDLKPEKGIPFSRQHVGTLMAQGRFPRAVHLGEMTRGWVESEIDQWLAARIAERDSAA